MAIFEKLPDRIEAVQWDGTVSGILSLQTMLLATGMTAGWYVVETTFNDDGEGYSKIKFDRNLYSWAPNSEGPSYMRESDWLSLVNGKLVIVPDEVISLQYKEIRS